MINDYMIVRYLG